MVINYKPELEKNDCNTIYMYGYGIWRSDMELGIITDESEIFEFIDCNDKYQVWDKYFNGWTYDLRLGNEVYLSSEDLPRKLKEGEAISIKSGEFALFITEEDIKLPLSVMAFISMKFGLKRKGMINVSGFHVDPSYKGKLIFSAYNAGPNDIVVRQYEPMFMIFFERIKPIPKEKERSGGYSNIPSQLISDIKGRSASLSNNAARIEKLEFYIKLLSGIVMALLSIVLGGVIKKLWGG